MLMACYMHLRAIPKRKMRVIFRSTGKLTKIFPRAVILGLYFSAWFDMACPFSVRMGGGIVRAPVCCRFLMALKMSRSSGGWIARPKISSGSYLSHSLIYRISFSRGQRYISGFGYSGMKF